VTYEILPPPLLAQLDPIPDGYTYIRLGEHILLMSVDSRIIRADVVDLARLPLARPAVAVSAPGVVVVPERVEAIGGGGCPPGLAKKNNGCLPPGQAKKAWIIGQPLPRQIAYEPMPRALWTQLTPPPPGYEYVRVADDIVLMSTETRVIAGLLGNLGNFRD
jgi:hypothetical protein